MKFKTCPKCKKKKAISKYGYRNNKVSGVIYKQIQSQCTMCRSKYVKRVIPKKKKNISKNKKVHRR